MRLRNGETINDDWKQLLSRQPTKVSDIGQFKDAAHLYYPNEDVAAYNYDCLIKLKQPVAEIRAKHSSEQSKKICSRDYLLQWVPV